MGGFRIRFPESISPLDCKRKSSPNTQSSEGISAAVFTKEDGGGGAIDERFENDLEKRER